MGAVPQDLQVMAEEGHGVAPPRQFGSLELEGQPSGLPAGERACLTLPSCPAWQQGGWTCDMAQELHASEAAVGERPVFTTLLHHPCDMLSVTCMQAYRSQGHITEVEYLNRGCPEILNFCDITLRPVSLHTSYTESETTVVVGSSTAWNCEHVMKRSEGHCALCSECAAHQWGAGCAEAGVPAC